MEFLTFDSCPDETIGIEILNLHGSCNYKEYNWPHVSAVCLHLCVRAKGKCNYRTEG